MERRNFIKAGVVAASSATMLSCSKSEAAYGPIIHSVYFWLKEGVTVEEVADFVNFFEALRPIASIQTLKYGKPAPVNPRPVVDNSFTYNLIVSFANMDDINDYENHPIHLAAIEKYEKFWTKVEVRDTML